VLVDGGTLYIDDGRPMPGQLEETIKNLREISADLLCQCSGRLCRACRGDGEGRRALRSFFKNLSIMAYGGARLPDDLYDRMQALAVKTTASASYSTPAGLDRDRADLDRHLLGHRAGRPDRPAVPRRPS